MKTPRFDDYEPGEFYDELFEAPGKPRPGARILTDRINSLEPGELQQRQAAAEASLFQMGVTFQVYGQDQPEERIWPFDIIPRTLEAEDWSCIERGLKQRIHALNLFVHDIYNEQRILKDGAVSRELILSARSYRPECEGLRPPHDTWCHITGTDLVRDADGQWYVLEDNLRCPSGVSYVLENRELLKRTFPNVFTATRVQPVADYPNRLLDLLHGLARRRTHKPVAALLTPGIYNSAYFEHAFLAQQMGIELVEGSDLEVADGFVHMRTTQGLQRVHVLYRRIDDDFLDPRVFRSDSALGVPGVMDAFRRGNVALANAPGTGIADDKSIYTCVPDIIRYYLGEDAILPNVPTYMCHLDGDRRYVMDHLDELVVKAVNESGGYGMLVGPHATPEEIDAFRGRIEQDPRNYIAQPMLKLSRVPTIVDDHFEGRHVDLRPYILYGEDVYVLPGGLTRVALKRGSTVVNSSQGGGSKDTWVVAE